MAERKIIINFGNTKVALNDLGHNVNDQFVSWYQSMFGVPAINMESFKVNSHAYFNFVENEEKKFEKHDLYFNNFTPVWISLINQKRLVEAENIWKKFLDIAIEWEKERSLRIHKGTPYYFWAVTCFLNEDLEKGFWLMNQALIEDILTKNNEEPNTPAKFFLYFETMPEQQFFRNKLLEIKDFLSKKLIENYSTTRNQTFDYSLFENKFLKNQQISKDVKFHFNLNVFRLDRILKQQKPDDRNTIASLLYLEIIFDLCRVFEYLIKSSDLFNSVKSFASRYKNTTIIKNLTDSNDFNTANFMKTLNELLNGTYQINNLNLDEIEKDVLISFGFRNFGAHKIEENKLIINNFENIIKSIVNSIFLAIELK